MKKIVVAALLLVFTAGSCSILNGIYEREVPKDLVKIPADGKVETDFVSFDQGWDDKTRGAFWFTPQGAEVLPYTWFTWLEQPGSKKLIRSVENMTSMGYLPMEASDDNPSGLPIGFAMTEAGRMDDAFVGFTCAACHTNMIEHDGKKFLIDGAPTLANFVSFFDQLVDALDETYKDNKKFVRFANKVLGEKHSKQSAVKLRKELLAAAKGTALRQKVNELPKHYPSDFTSYGRLDAFTNIMNAGSAFALDMMENKNYPIAPVSYPFLWGTHQSDVVQWNGSAPNIPRIVGPMVRNAGEVVGVFGGLTIKNKPGRKGKFNYKSTIDFPGLGQLEGFVKSLQAPQWDDEESNLPAVDPKMVARGEILYKNNCGRCHTVIDQDKQLQDYKAKMVALEAVGTDPIAAWAGEHYMASSGILKGSKAEILAGDVMKDTVRAISLPVNGVVGLILRSPGKMVKGVMITKKEGKKVIQDGMDKYNHVRDSMTEARYQEAGHHQWTRTQNTPTDLKLDGLKYKARPLNGIWATAPYLHNGSVPNLWELLQAPEDRIKTFWVGSRKYDAKKVGFESDRPEDGSNGNKFCVNESCDDGPDAKIMLGNSNLGHDYAGGQYTEQQKWDIIEYMKTL